MTKTLTEQWRDRELPNGNYYTICSGWNMQTFPCVVYCERNCFGANVIEVLSTVPSYDEYKQLVSKTDELVQKMHILEKRLEIATNTLKSFIPDDLTEGGFGEMYEDVIWDCKKALEEMEGVK